MAEENEPKQDTPKTFTQDEVNEIMGKVRRETREKIGRASCRERV